ncbi:hypothetical protein SG34_017400 [Thalassomonas viridans]|uniref:Uncharacterized protein n=1 Tax=Thalassomonas viridans TaxID=137584 RepID=A0AAE9YZD7_9GAMM|nr:hypothetical protein [Thalassomonas viridans]WDE03184.1 hypothetical protein SG34_017400 [Thalassomonas viridans]
MNYIAQLLPAQRAVKSEHSHKDKKQKNPFVAADGKSGQENAELMPEPETVPLAADDAPAETFTERRSGDDRRKKNITRGRWLDSREKQDRRQPADIYVRI